MRRLIVVALLVLLAPLAFSWPLPGGLPRATMPAAALPARGLPDYGTASPPAPPVISSGATVARWIALFGMLLLLLGSSVHNGILQRRILVELRNHRPMPPEIAAAQAELERYLSGPPPKDG